VLAAWGLSGGTPPTDGSQGAPAAARPATYSEPAQLVPLATASTASPPVSATAAPPPAVAAAQPIQYVGQWMEGSRVAVMLGYQGRSVVVRVPGRVDDRYEVVSADGRELVLRDLTAATTQRLALGASPASATSAAAALPAEPSVGVRVRPDKLPPPSQRTSDDYEPEN
jgi:hypothetical protein